MFDLRQKEYVRCLKASWLTPAPLPNSKHHLLQCGLGLRTLADPKRPPHIYLSFILSPLALLLAGQV